MDTQVTKPVLFHKPARQRFIQSNFEFNPERFRELRQMCRQRLSAEWKPHPGDAQYFALLMKSSNAHTRRNARTGMLALALGGPCPPEALEAAKIGLRSRNLDIVRDTAVFVGLAVQVEISRDVTIYLEEAFIRLRDTKTRPESHKMRDTVDTLASVMRTAMAHGYWITPEVDMAIRDRTLLREVN